MQLVNKNKKKKERRKKGRKKEREGGGGEGGGRAARRESLNARKTPRPIYIVHLNNTFFHRFKSLAALKKGLKPHTEVCVRFLILINLTRSNIVCISRSRNLGFQLLIILR